MILNNGTWAAAIAVDDEKETMWVDDTGKENKKKNHPFLESWWKRCPYPAQNRMITVGCDCIRPLQLTIENIKKKTIYVWGYFGKLQASIGLQ